MSFTFWGGWLLLAIELDCLQKDEKEWLVIGEFTSACVLSISLDYVSSARETGG